MTTVPRTYTIEYGFHYLDSPKLLQQVNEAPPDIVHVGHDLPFKSPSGPRLVPMPMVGRFEERYPLLDPARLKVYTARLTGFVAGLHRAGVRVVIPYICNQTMGGNPDTRSGFWEFYDHWEDYLEFGLPPKPAADPIEWMQRDPQGHISFNYPKMHPAFAPAYRWAPCPNNPHWTAYLAFTAVQAAECGYDGVFVDNNILHCYCRWCQAAFRRYMSGRHPGEDSARLELSWEGDPVSWALAQPGFRDFLNTRKGAEIRERFGVERIETAQQINDLGNGYLKRPAREFARPRLETPRARALWFETQRFWAWSIAENLLRIREAARRRNPAFLVIPNWGAMRTLANVDGRRQDAKNVVEWSRGCQYMMFEEDGMPGRLAPGIYHDYLSQYKLGLACGVRPVVLPYGPESEAVLDLAHAEAAASGGGAFVQPGYRFPEVRRRYRALYDRHPELFEGYTSFAEVAVAFLFDQVHHEHLAHLEHLHHVKRALDAGGVLFDYLVEADLRPEKLSRYRIVILPEAVNLDQNTLHALARWAQAGGRLVVTGSAPALSGAGITRVADIRQAAPMSADERRLLDLGSQALNEAVRRLPQTPHPVERPLLALLDKLAGHPLAWTERPDLGGVRAMCYQRSEQQRTRMLLHLINYDLSESRNPEPVRGLPVSLPLAGAVSLKTLRAYSAAAPEGLELEGEIRAGRLRFRAPDFRVHVLIEALAEGRI